MARMYADIFSVDYTSLHNGSGYMTLEQQVAEYKDAARMQLLKDNLRVLNLKGMTPMKAQALKQLVDDYAVKTGFMFDLLIVDQLQFMEPEEAKPGEADWQKEGRVAKELIARHGCRVELRAADDENFIIAFAGFPAEAAAILQQARAGDLSIRMIGSESLAEGLWSAAGKLVDGTLIAVAARPEQNSRQRYATGPDVHFGARTPKWGAGTFRPSPDQEVIRRSLKPALHQRSFKAVQLTAVPPKAIPLSTGPGSPAHRQSAPRDRRAW